MVCASYSILDQVRISQGKKGFQRNDKTSRSRCCSERSGVRCGGARASSVVAAFARVFSRNVILRKIPDGMGKGFVSNRAELACQDPSAFLTLSLFAVHVPETHMLQGLLCQVQIVLDDFLLCMRGLSRKKTLGRGHPGM